MLTHGIWRPIVGSAGHRGRARHIVEDESTDDRVGRPEGELQCSDLEADREDMALAEQALEEYEAEDVKGPSPYNKYRAKRLGAAD